MIEHSICGGNILKQKKPKKQKTREIRIPIKKQNNYRKNKLKQKKTKKTKNKRMKYLFEAK